VHDFLSILRVYISHSSGNEDVSERVVRDFVVLPPMVEGTGRRLVGEAIREREGVAKMFLDLCSPSIFGEGIRREGVAVTFFEFRSRSTLSF
jgi:hypothetical protein